MSFKMKNIVGFSLVSVMAMACVSPFNGADQALTVSQEHPITVDQHTATMTIEVDPTLSDLSSLNKARLRAFANEYNSKGHGPITISAPSGGSNDLLGEEMAADIRAVLRLQGVSYENMTGASYRVSSQNENNNLILSYSAYTANASKCGNYSGEYFRRVRNLRSRNFGCATQNNLAAMIADPRDLTNSDALSASGAERAVTVLDNYAAGTATFTPPITINESAVTE